MTLKTEHFSRWAGAASQATGSSPTRPLYLSRRGILNQRGSLKPQVKNATINILYKPEAKADMQVKAVSGPVPAPNSRTKPSRRQSVIQPPVTPLNYFDDCNEDLGLLERDANSPEEYVFISPKTTITKTLFLKSQSLRDPQKTQLPKS